MDDLSQDKNINSLINNEINNILDHIDSSLSFDSENPLDTETNMRDILHNMISSIYNSIINKYLASIEGVDNVTPNKINDLLIKPYNSIEFNSPDIEKSIIKMYETLQKHINKEINNFETTTIALLNQKAGLGQFETSKNAYSVVKAMYKDNIIKPKTVTDFKFSVNILDEMLINPIFKHNITSDYLIREIISKHILDEINLEIEESKKIILQTSNSKMSKFEEIFEKINRVEEHVSDDLDDPNSVRYRYITKKLMEKINNVDSNNLDNLSISNNIENIINSENLRDKGFIYAVNSLTSILDKYNMSYQFIENQSNNRELIINEYENDYNAKLPDEHFQISLKYFDSNEINSHKEIYNLKLKKLDEEITKIFNVINTINLSSKKFGSISNFDNLYNKVKKDIIKQKKLYGEQFKEYVNTNSKEWDEISFIKPDKSNIERENPVYEYEQNHLKNQLVNMKKKLEKKYNHEKPIERVILEKQIDFLEEQYKELACSINPYHLQPGLLLDVNIVSIKKRQITLNRAKKVISEFLNSISKGLKCTDSLNISSNKETKENFTYI
ncbi:MAG: cytoplasmic filament protein CfpA [Spirochaetota bacterium]|nr:cytoplasmic filament protein CfpA [Spirochaetota bacterium]